MDQIELELDTADEELVSAFATVVRDLALERRDMADPMTAVEADRRLGEQVTGGAVEYVPSALFRPPIWLVHRSGSSGRPRTH